VSNLLEPDEVKVSSPVLKGGRGSNTPPLPGGPVRLWRRRAIFDAAGNAQKAGSAVAREIMIPLVGFLPELEDHAKIVHYTAAQVIQEKGVQVNQLVGTMIELPRACIVADQIANEVASPLALLTQTSCIRSGTSTKVGHE
jgi:hypothetical protein